MRRERKAWAEGAGVVRRSYANEVLAKLEPLREKFDVEQYGSLSQDPARYPLYCIKTRGFGAANGKPCVLVTGGVHGYETSGVQGALLFVATEMEALASKYNIVVCPCVSPWGYECIQRWNAKAVDPNRSFRATAAECPAEESAAVVALVASLGVPQWRVHVDLHETTDTDDSEFRPAKAARDGLPLVASGIPDGFYLVGDSAVLQPEWHAAILDAVRAVTHVAPPDSSDKICGEPTTQDGVICVPTHSLSLCSSVTNATHATTTEVYPDSKTRPVTGTQCNQAQVAAVVGALRYIEIASTSK
eukprot:g3542.t1